MNRVIILDAVSGDWLEFENPVAVIESFSGDQVIPLLSHIEDRVNAEGLHAAGFIAYDAATGMDFAMSALSDAAYPCVWFGLFREPVRKKRREVPPGPTMLPVDWTQSVSHTDYIRSIERIKEHIRAGETYQVNFTYRLHAPFSLDPLEYFRSLVASQQCAYGAYIETPSFAVCSASPELFFRLDRETIISRPMKGTHRRGLTLAADRACMTRLHNSEKDRAENVMIVDMVRNDIGRIADPGSVEVTQLFAIERYPTVLQMTSSITGKTTASVTEILRAMFPAASITGAPKIRTMKIITELETAPRHVYTGSIGFLSPGRTAQFNVAIRTALIDKRAGTAEYGVGGGIVWASTPEEEYEESRLKSKVLSGFSGDFSLLETILWTPAGGYFLLHYHMQRLRDSAEYFGFAVDTVRIQGDLKTLASSFMGPCRLRVLLSRQGEPRYETSPLEEQVDRPVRIRLAPFPVDPSDPFLYHKTTHRRVYERARAGVPDCDDVLLWNSNGEITETSIANVVCEIDGELITPPVSAGLLPGTFRQWLLDREIVVERVLVTRDLGRCKNLYLINSLRLWRNATLSERDAVRHPVVS